MAKNRTIPFGYCMRNGKITVDLIESKAIVVKRIERYNSLKNSSLKIRRTGIIDTDESKFQKSQGLERWAIIHNMQEASKIINLLTEKDVSSVEELEEKLLNLHGERLDLAEQLNDLQDKINSRSELIKLLETYREYKPLYAQYKEVRAKEKFHSLNQRSGNFTV